MKNGDHAFYSATHSLYANELAANEFFHGNCARHPDLWSLFNL